MTHEDLLFMASNLSCHELLAASEKLKAYAAFLDEQALRKQVLRKQEHEIAAMMLLDSLKEAWSPPPEK